MLFKRIFVEKQIANHDRVQRIARAFPDVEPETIESMDDIFGKVRKPYLHKRTDLNLVIAEKRGSLVKPAPPAYGFDGEPHYYFFHAYNCIYECEYCYLQGYFDSPDIVVFINHEDVCAAIEETASAHDGIVWFHAGEFSDSLALAHLTREWPVYWETFKRLPNAFLELRTKSVNIKPIEELEALDNIIISFSLSPPSMVKLLDRKTAGYRGRINAIARLAAKGFKIGLHLDPIIYHDSFRNDYDKLLSDVFAILPFEQLEYISAGVVRFTGKVYKEVLKNYPESALNTAPFVKSFDNKVRYNRPLRMHMLREIEKIAIARGVDASRIYLCMEE